MFMLLSLLVVLVAVFIIGIPIIALVGVILIGKRDRQMRNNLLFSGLWCIAGIVLAMMFNAYGQDLYTWKQIAAISGMPYAAGVWLFFHSTRQTQQAKPPQPSRIRFRTRLRLH